MEYADGIYHATARGMERGRIVRDKVDREGWVENLEAVVKERAWRVFAFALISKHLCSATKRQIADALGYKSQTSLQLARARIAQALESASIRRKVNRLEKKLNNDS